MLLEQIKKENDIKKLNSKDLPLLAKEIRSFLIHKVSKTGGHLASNLGVVELTIALHRALDLPKDKIIWDVGHQSYVHKLLTGRRAGFDDLRTFGGMSGFPKRSESPCDAFDTGHSSTSISAGLGYAAARDLKGEDSTIVSVIGDGSFTGGMAFEALNNASRMKSNFIIILNDNHMSISENIGGLSTYLGSLRTAGFYTGLKKGVNTALTKVPYVGEPMRHQIKKTKDSIKHLVVPGMLFEDMGITYIGPVPGHNITVLSRAIKEAKRVKGPVLVHVITQKGKGYEPAENAPDKFHGVGPFMESTGESLNISHQSTYTELFGKTIFEAAETDERIVAVTAAMADGTGLKSFQKKYPKRFYDVGIAEGHAVTFAAGLAAGGLKPVFAVYSSFLQRGFDQIIHDVAMQKLPVMFAIDRAGLVGQDGETHQGVFDISYLTAIPNMTVMAPKDGHELYEMVKFGINYPGPIAVRYPRGKAFMYNKESEALSYGKAEVIAKGKRIAILSVGHTFETALKVRKLLGEKGFDPSLVNLRFIKPLDEELLFKLSRDHDLFAVIEENEERGGVGEQIALLLDSKNLHAKVLDIAIKDKFVEHGNIKDLLKHLDMAPDAIAENIIRQIRGTEE